MGKDAREAQQLLATQAGVAEVSIHLPSGQTLPSDPTKISIVVQGPPGA